MKTRIFLLTVLFVVVSYNIKAQRTTFIKSFDLARFATILPTTDNGCLIANSGHISKLNSEGFTEWESSLDISWSADQSIQLSNGNYFSSR